MNGRTMTRVAPRRGPARGVVALGAALALTAGACDMIDDPTMGSSEQELTFGTVITVDTTAPLEEVYAEFDWAMQPRAFAARYAYTPNGDWKEQFDEDYLYPEAYFVAFDACDSAAIGTEITRYTWQFQGNGVDETPRVTTDCFLPARSTGPQVVIPGCKEIDSPQCDVDTESVPVSDPVIGAPEFPNTGSYTVTLTVRAANGMETTVQELITLKDLLVLSIGDSMSSGEGVPHDTADNPEVAAVLDFLNDFIDERSLLTQVVSYSVLSMIISPVGVLSLLLGDFFADDEPVWFDEPCHRSLLGGPAMAAMLFDVQHPHLSVTFMSHACSGAKTRDLYEVAQKSGREHQLQAARRNLCRGASNCSSAQRRAVDVVLLSSGINDIGFAGMIEGAAGVGSVTAPDLAPLRTRHDALAAKLVELGSPEVFIAEYPIYALKQGDSYGGCGTLSGISSAEAIQLTSIGEDLNDTVAASAAANGWDLVGGVADKFLGRGYCTPNGVKSWMVGVTESIIGQGDHTGAMHPNYAGHVELSRLFQARMNQVLMPTAPPEHIPDWPARRAGGAGEDFTRAVAQAENGDIIAGGTFRNTMWLEGQSLSSAGGQDGFVARMDGSGNLLWMNSAGGSGDARIYDVAVAPNGDVIAAGAFKGWMSIDGFTRQATGWDGFVVAFDGWSGAQKWVRTYHGNGDQFPLAVAVDAAGRTVVTGYFKTQVATPTQVDAVIRPAINTTRNNCFVGWINPEGQHTSLIAFGGTGHCEARDVALSRTGSAAVTGRFSGTLTADAYSNKKLKSDGGYDSFVVRYTPLAKFDWAAYIGGVNYYDNTNVGDTAAWSVAVDADEHIYVAGQFYKYNWVQAPGNSSYLFGYANNWDGVVIELGPEGTIEHSKTFGGSGNEYIYGVTANWDGSYAVAGRFDSTDMKVDGVNVCRVGTTDALVLAFEPGGDLRWARNHGQSGTTIAYSVSAGLDGTIVAGGEFVNKLKVDDGTFIQSQGSKDGFVTRVKPGVVPTILPGLCLTTPGEISM